MRKLEAKLIAAAIAIAASTIPASMCIADAATPPSDAARAAAMKKYEAGSKAFAAKHYKDAIDLFLEADQTVPNADLAFNTSLAYEAMGDGESALRWAREYLRRAGTNAEDRAEVESRVSKLERRLQEKGVQQVTVLSTPLGATVFIDDRAVGVTSWTGELLPGSHRVSLKLEGYETDSEVFDLRADRSLDVNVTLKTKALVSAPVAPSPAPAPPPPRRDEREASPSAPAALLPVGITTAALGVCAFAAAGGLEAARASAENAARKAPVQVDAQSHLDAMQSYQLGARVAAGVGAGLVLAGGTMAAIGLAMRPSKSKSAPAVSALCLPGACAASLIGRF